MKTALVPLSIAAGQSLDVWTGDEETEAWFADAFLQAQKAELNSEYDATTPWWKASSSQSSHGILLGVAPDIPDRASNTTPRITEVLLYATITDKDSQTSVVTPPPSSSPRSNVPDQLGHSGSQGRELRIRALPLSSDLLHRPSRTSSSHEPALASPLEPLSERSFECSAAEESIRLPSTGIADNHHPSSPSLKRRRISNLFDDVAERKRRAKQCSGELISQAARQAEARISDAKSHPGDAPQRPSLSRHRSSRSSSISSYRSARDFEVQRPVSRRTALAETKRSSLSQMVNLGGPGDSQDLDLSIETKNKNALSRIVMAGLRIYGLQQKRSSRKSFSHSTTGPPESDVKREDTEDVDEYKLVYHQAYKGACFAMVSLPCTNSGV